MRLKEMRLVRLENKMFYYDAHCHLLTKKRFQKAKEQGVKYFIVNATHPDNWEEVAALARQETGVLGCVGVHPWFVNNLPDDWFLKLNNLLLENPLLMVGEIGLDAARADLPYQAQVFENCLKLARLHKRPVHVHGVKAWSNLVDILACYSDVPCLLHRYSGSPAHTKHLLTYNTWFSFIRGKAFQNAPADRVLTESDSPDGLHRSEGVKALVEESGVSLAQFDDNFLKFISCLNGVDKVVEELKGSACK